MSERNLTPEQERLRRRLATISDAALIAVVVADLALGLGKLWHPGFYWVAGVAGIVLVVLSAQMISGSRTLRSLGPPFENFRWWWPWRSASGPARERRTLLLRIIVTVVVGVVIAYIALRIDVVVRGPCAPLGPGRFVSPTCQGPEPNYWLAAAAGLVATTVAWLMLARIFRRDRATPGRPS